MGKKKKIRIIPAVSIVDIGAKGKAIGRTVDGETVLVEDAVPGDVTTVRVVKKRKGMKVTVPVSYEQRSADRVEPVCRYFGTCGGCKWQNLAYAAQLRFKEKAVRDALQRIGGIRDADVAPIIGSGKTEFYRNKLEFTFTDSRWLTREELDSDADFDRRGLGFHVPGSYARVVDIGKCHLQPDPSNAIRNEVRRIALEHDYAFQDIRNKKGFLRNLVIRTSSKGEVMVVLIIMHEDMDALRTIMDALIAKFPEIVSAYYCINDKLNDAYYDLDFIHYYGAESMDNVIGHVHFKLGPKAFFQTNDVQAKVLFDTVVEMAELQPMDTVYDLYCGIGSITLYVARQVKQIVGIEEVPEAIDDARTNAGLNSIANAEFFTGDVKDIMSGGQLQGFPPPDVIITDPPRAGMHAEVVAAIAQLAPRKVVYVSCNPATQARDIALLSERYNFVRAQPVDMFPHTSHIENVALLALR